MPDKMSQEKVRLLIFSLTINLDFFVLGYVTVVFLQSIILKALGATVVRTPREVEFDHPESHLQKSAAMLNEMSGNAHIPNQYTNPYNPVAHFDCTGQEILDACAEGEPDAKPRIDMIVCGAGTGGTITGIARLIKMKLPSCQVIKPSYCMNHRWR